MKDYTYTEQDLGCWIDAAFGEKHAGEAGDLILTTETNNKRGVK